MCNIIYLLLRCPRSCRQQAYTRRYDNIMLIGGYHLYVHRGYRRGRGRRLHRLPNQSVFAGEHMMYLYFE